MINIVTGDDIKSSRNFYFDKKSDNPTSFIFDGKNLNFAEVFQALNNSSLFVEGPIFIENLFSNIKNADNLKVFDLLVEKENEIEVYLWEENVPTKTLLNKFKKPNVIAFELPKSLFTFLDSIRPRNERTNLVTFKKALEGNEPEILFYMLVRHFRILIALEAPAKENIDEVSRLAPWQRDKLQRQSRLFGHEKLINEYKRLYEIDYSQKTGNTSLTLTQAIDFFLADL